MISTNKRPNPDAILHRIKEEEEKSKRGKLKIFFGGCAGVGKTYAMLSAAHEQLQAAVDVVAGVIETHGRTETERLLASIPTIPQLSISHKGVTLKELDIDTIKTRKPDIVLVDELAHTNAPGVRHPKRWQDVEELLDSGIDVYTTLNVQHLESLSDIVAGNTGIVVKETVPDSVFDNANDIILVDINADELLKRVKEGKVYIAEYAKSRAMEHFFKKKNIIALREMALRRTADRVDAQMGDYYNREGIHDTAPVAEKIMVCIGPDPLSAKLVRSAKRMATALKAPWVAVYVENSRHTRLNEQGRLAVSSVMHMAERNGGKTVILQGNNAVDEIMGYARANRITKIIIGKPTKGQLKDILHGSLVDKIIHHSGDIDVYVITGEPVNPTAFNSFPSISRFKWPLYLWGVAAVAGCTTISYFLDTILQPIDQIMVYLIGTLLVAAKLGRGPSLLFALLSVSAFNFFFIEPLYSFNIAESSYWMTLLVMLITSLVISAQAAQLRLQTVFARKRANENQIFYAMTRDMAATRGTENIASTAVKHMQAVLDMDITVWNVDSASHVGVVTGYPPYFDIKEESTIRWCYENRQMAGRNTNTMPTAKGVYIPLLSSDRIFGVLGIIPKDGTVFEDTIQLPLIEIFANILASSLERARAAESAEQSKVEAESEKLRNILLSSVSHDLRTPLATISGASSSLLLEEGKLSADDRRELLLSIHEESERLSKIVSNLLDVTRLESTDINLNRHYYGIDELIGNVLLHIEDSLHNHSIKTVIEEGLPFLYVDGVLIEQLLVNLLENAVKYTPEGTVITLTAAQENGKLIVSVADEGSGIPEGEEEKIFDKFYSSHGTGLGLAICRGIVTAHGGKIKAENRAEGGARFSFIIPIKEENHA